MICKESILVLVRTIGEIEVKKILSSLCNKSIDEIFISYDGEIFYS